MTTKKSPKQERQGAERVVKQLRSRGFDAFLVGGCVRDRLLNRTPKEFDIATSASPQEVIATFKRTVPVGIQFGVVMVLVPEGEYEVATFRAETSYSDGRRPDSVTFVSAKEDVLRRDFTINGLLEDPETGVIKDFVGGQADLKAGVIRAIGDPLKRFTEDHLRMLRAIRFAATLGFDIEVGTFAALTQMAEKVGSVSGERIHTELRRMFEEGDPVRAHTLLAVTRMLQVILPQATDQTTGVGQRTLAALENCSFTTALAVCLGPVDAGVGDEVARQLKLANEQKTTLNYLLKTRADFDTARSQADTIRFIRHALWPMAADLARAERIATGDPTDAVDALVARRAALSQDELNPPKLLTGNDLKTMGLQPGPHFKALLTDLETEQLEGRITTREQAEAFVKQQQ